MSHTNGLSYCDEFIGDNDGGIRARHVWLLTKRPHNLDALQKYGRDIDDHLERLRRAP
tara:strand:- start:262 stop:435 length:174 start_codon:yes stop_codon:yes gene_type:complete